MALKIEMADDDLPDNPLGACGTGHDWIAPLLDHVSTLARGLSTLAIWHASGSYANLVDQLSTVDGQLRQLEAEIGYWRRVIHAARAQLSDREERNLRRIRK